MSNFKSSQMKKIKFILTVILLNSVLFSCTPESIVENVESQACCDEGEHIPPPPPPPNSGLGG